MTKTRKELSAVIAGALVVATVGVVIQIVGGVDYPPVPPVFFIQLVPAALVYFGRWRWTAALAVVAGVFLVAGLFVSGAASQLVEWGLPALGLWVQMIAVVGAMVAGVVALVRR